MKIFEKFNILKGLMNVETQEDPENTVTQEAEVVTMIDAEGLILNKTKFKISVKI